MTKRGTSNTNSRGSAASRRIRKRWLLKTFGDGETCLCSTCPTVLTFDTLTVDRYPIPGVDGGTYRRGNIRPQCQPCASKQGGDMSKERKARKHAAAVLAAVAVLATGCSDYGRDANGNERPDIIDPHYVELPDHRSVLCVFEKAGYGGGLSCDWAQAKR